MSWPVVSCWQLLSRWPVVSRWQVPSGSQELTRNKILRAFTNRESLILAYRLATKSHEHP